MSSLRRAAVRQPVRCKAHAAAAGGAELASANFTAPEPVFRWHPPPSAARATAVAFRMKSEAPLHLAEARDAMRPDTL